MSRTNSTTRTPVQLAATVVGAVFLVVGIAGFIPGLTTEYDTLQFAGHHSEAMLFGVAGLALARTARGAYLFLVGGAVIYLVLWLYGLLIDHDSAANFVPLNTADNWLHLLLAVGMAGLGMALGRSSLPRRT